MFERTQIPFLATFSVPSSSSLLKVPNIAILMKTSALHLEKRISCYCFLNKYSKEVFDYGAGIHAQAKGRLFEKKKKM